MLDKTKGGKMKKQYTLSQKILQWIFGTSIAILIIAGTIFLLKKMFGI